MFSINDRVILHDTNPRLNGKRGLVLSKTFSTDNSTAFYYVLFDDGFEGTVWEGKLKAEGNNEEE